MPDRDPTAALARRAGRGDREALAALVSATQGDVWRLCAHLVDPVAADDLTQESFVRVMSGLPAFRGDASGRTFVLAVARRTCIDEIRRRSRRRLFEMSVLRDRSRGEPDPPALDPGDTVDLELLIATLDPDRREAFVLTQLLGLSYADAAEVCGCPVGTIRSRVARARGDLVASIAGERSAGAEEA